MRDGRTISFITCCEDAPYSWDDACFYAGLTTSITVLYGSIVVARAGYVPILTYFGPWDACSIPQSQEYCLMCEPGTVYVVERTGEPILNEEGEDKHPVAEDFEEWLSGEGYEEALDLHQSALTDD